MSISVADFPAEVIEQILLFVPTPRQVCRFATTCSDLLQLVSTNERLWNEMYIRRWSMRDDSIAVYTRQHYRDRHEQDAETISRVVAVSESLAQQEDYGLGKEYENPMWLERIDNIESFDVLRFIAKEDPSIKALYNTDVSTILRCVATQLMDIVNSNYALRRFRDLLVSHMRGDFDIHSDKTTTLEEGAVLLAAILSTWRELLDEVPRNREQRVRDILDDLGRQLQSRLEMKGSMDKLNPQEAVHMLNEIMIHERGFAGNNENYYDVKNSAIDHVLQSRKGIPLTLAIIYKLVLHRVGITTSIVGLPGHVLLGLPGTETFVDVFNGGLILSLDDCRGIAESYQTSWRDSFTEPMSIVDIFSRILRNFQNCLPRTMMVSPSLGVRTTRICFALTPTIGNLQSAVFHRIDAKFGSSASALIRLDDVGVAWNQVPFLDPDVFHHYNLINAESSVRYNEESLRRFMTLRSG